MSIVFLLFCTQNKKNCCGAEKSSAYPLGSGKNTKFSPHLIPAQKFGKKAPQRIARKIYREGKMPFVFAENKENEKSKKKNIKRRLAKLYRKKLFPRGRKAFGVCIYHAENFCFKAVTTSREKTS